MKRNNFWLLPFFLLSVYPTSKIHPIEIPISSFDSGKDDRQFRIAYADVELIYDICPQRARAAADYRAAKEKFELAISSISAALDKRGKELEDLDKEIAELRLASSPLQVSPGKSSPDGSNIGTSFSTAQARGVEAIYEKEIARKALAADVAKLSAELKSARESMESALPRLEKEYATSVLEELYKVLAKIAAEEDLILIIDKNYILYAPETYDITHKVIERLK